MGDSDVTLAVCNIKSDTKLCWGADKSLDPLEFKIPLRLVVEMSALLLWLLLLRLLLLKRLGQETLRAVVAAAALAVEDEATRRRRRRCRRVRRRQTRRPRVLRFSGFSNVSLERANFC